MQNGPSRTSTSTQIPSLAPILPFPQKKQTRKQKVRGSAFARLEFHGWRKDFDPDRIRMWLRSRALAGMFSDAERYVITLLIEHGEQVVQGRMPLSAKATLGSVAIARGKSEASTRRLLSRLGKAGIVINLGTGKAFDLAVHGQVQTWRIDVLQALRKGRRKAIAEWEQRRPRTWT